MQPSSPRTLRSIRRECLDHLIVLSEDRLHRILTDYVRYYNESRTHLSLDRNAPERREVEAPDQGTVIAVPQLGGLHHYYTRVAA